MRKRLWWALGFASGGWGIALAARLCAPFSRHLTGLLRLYVLPAMGRAFARAPLPVGELAAVLLLAFAAYSLFGALRQRRMGRWAGGLALALSFLYFCYAVLWMPLYALPRAEAPEYDDGALVALIDDLTEQVNALAGQFSAPTPAETLREANALMGGGGKLARFPEWMRALSIAGIYLPWTAEALLNPGEPAWTLPFTACHELAHARGVAGELEANLVAYYACRSLGSSAFAHSANLYMLRYALGELYLRSESLWQAACQKLSAAARREMASIHGFAAPQSAPLGDILLRLSGDERGQSSYSGVVAALIAAEGKTLQP